MNSINSKILQSVKKIHFIGIGGVGMSGIAEYLVKNGYEVSGSDSAPGEITNRLSSFGVRIFEGHNASNVNKNIDLVVYSAAIKADNPELAKTLELGIHNVKRAKMLGEIVNNDFLIAVSGTHGKTSTTAMVAKVLIDCGLDPTVFVGGAIDFLEDGNSRIGKGKYSVVEADEYDRSFLTLKPDIVIITNVDLDHTDIYKDLGDLKNAFKEFLKGGKENCRIIGFGDDRNVADLLNSVNNICSFTYGFGKQNKYVIEESYLKDSKIRYEMNGEYIDLSVPGKHNVLNSAASFIAGSLLELDPGMIKLSLKSFFGVKRRLELKYENDIRVYDDYAHHPTEIEYSLFAVKEISKSRVITVFQPHTYTRTRDFFGGFAKALKDNDITILLDLYPAREKAIEGVSTELIYDKMKSVGLDNVYYEKSFDNAIKKLGEIVKKDDTIIFQGAGDVTNLCSDFVNKLKNTEN